MSDHDELHELVGAYVLGGLSPADRAAFDAHLEACEPCRDELVGLAGLPGRLAQIGVEDLEPMPAGRADAVVARARADLDRLQRSRRWWRAGAGAAALIALVAVAVAVLIDGSTSTEPVDRDRVELVVDRAADVEGALAADPRAWGTYLHVDLTEMPWRDRYRVWVVDHAGQWFEAGSWRPSTARPTRLGVSTHLDLGDIARVLITSEDPADRLVRASPP